MAVAKSSAEPAAKQVSTAFGRLTDWLLAGRVSSAAEQRGAQFLVACCGTGFVAGLVSLPIAEQNQVAGFWAWIAAMLALPLLLRTRMPVWAVQCTTLLVTDLLLMALCLAFSTLYWQQLYWFAMLPLCGGLLAQARGVLFGALLSITSALFIIWFKWQRGGLDPTLAPNTLEAVFDVNLFFVAMLVLTAIYVTMHTRALERAERAARARSAFLAHMSHELRTPMNGVLGVLQLIDTAEVPRGVRDQLALVQRSGEAMVAIVDDLLDYTRLEADAIQFVDAAFEPRVVTSDVVALMAARAQAKQIQLDCNVDAGVPERLRGDALRIRQVLHNLLSNAVKFTAVGGVRVTVQWAANQLTIAVDDDGIGIADDVLPRLFVPFRQADAGTAQRFGGSGLGLAIARGLARGMGGDIAATSMLGKGSSFRFSCKALVASSVAVMRVATAEPDARTAAALAGRVLIVDDNEINCIVSRRMCERAGLEVRLAFDGAAALEAITHEHFDLVLMDVHMPVMDGFEATRRIRELSGGRAAVPIVAVTASAMADEIERCRASGMNDVVAKPIDGRRLAAVLSRHLRPASEARYLH